MILIKYKAVGKYRPCLLFKYACRLFRAYSMEYCHLVPLYQIFTIKPYIKNNLSKLMGELE